MFKNSFKIALRSIRRYKAISFINIFGLALGMACCLLVFLWVQDGYRFDRFHENKNRIYQVYSELKYQDGRETIFTGSFYPLPRILREEVPEVSDALRYEQAANVLVKYGEKSTINNTISMADPSFFRVFSFPFVRGHVENVLSDRNSIVITERMAQKYFGEEDPIGKVLNVNGQEDLKVTGVIKDIPYHSSLQFDCIIPFVLQFGSSGKEPTHWGGNPFTTFVLFHKNVDLSDVTEKMNHLFIKYNPFEKVRVNFHLHPLTHLHLYSPGGGGLIQLMMIFLIFALFVLLIACFNFVNLSTAKSAARSNEIGLRKVIGAKRSDLIRQFFGESVLQSFLTLSLALMLVSLFIPAFNSLMNKQISMKFLMEPVVIAGVVGITLLTGIVSGIYPALFLSSFRPIQALKGTGGYGARSPVFRKGLVIVQFALSIFLITGTIASYRQMNFIRNKDLGYDQKDVLCVRMIGNLTDRYETVKSELLRNPNIVSITRSLQHPVNIASTVTAIDWDGKNPDESFSMNFEYVDYDYFKTLGMEIVDGRPFSTEYSTDLNEGYIVNEEAVRLMGMASPVGKRLSVFRKEGQIIGVVKNFHFQPLNQPIRPFVIGADPGWSKDWMFIKLKTSNVSETVTSIKNTCKKFDFDDSVMNFHFLADALDNSYRAERLIGKISAYLTVLAVLISCMGLFGLVSYLTQQRTKEIGIRKLLGASVHGIYIQFCWKYMKWIIWANIFALPVAYFIINRWLMRYAYKIDLNIWIFIFSGLAAMVIALLTVSFQSIKAATANPADSLRYE
jgi:putative ABC transport system permease protein